MAIDLDSPIVPGHSAGGIRLGASTDELLQRAKPENIRRLSGRKDRFDFGVLSVWCADGIIDQIGVREGYRGSLHNGVMVGMSIGEIESRCGSIVVEDEEDNLTVAGSPGWCFETETWKGHDLDGNRDARVTKIFVFRV